MSTLDDPQVFLPDLWATYAKFQPAKTAIVCGDRRVSWGDFNRGMNRVANRLVVDRIGRGDKVAVLMANAVEMLEIMFGIVKAGACVVPVSTLLAAEQTAALLDDADAVMVFASADQRDKVDAVRDRLGKLRVGGLVAVDFAAEGWRCFADWLGDAGDGEPGVNYRLDDPFNIIYSSGTTGLPKGIVQTHRARQHWSYSNAIEMRFDSNAIALTTTALYSNGTWLMVLPALFAGATLVVMERFEPKAFLETVAREHVTHTFMVPTQYIMTLAEPDFGGYDLSSLRVMLSAGSSLRQDTKEAILARMGKGLYELYGASEGLATMLKPEQHEGKLGSVGKPVLGFDICIIDDDGRELPRGETGEIVGYGAGLMTGYYKKPEATAATIWRDERGRSYVRTGDMGRFDGDGFLYILDRKKDMIISGGFNVFPSDIEEVVGAHPDVSDVAVIGVPHEKWGETALALVILREGAGADPAAIRDWANARLAKHQRLSAVELREAFPRNALGKVLKRSLRETYWKPKAKGPS